MSEPTTNVYLPARDVVATVTLEDEYLEFDLEYERMLLKRLVTMALGLRDLLLVCAMGANRSVL